MKKFLKGIFKLGAGVAIFLSICLAINGLGNFLTRRVTKKQTTSNTNTVTTSVNGEDITPPQSVQTEEPKVTIDENKVEISPTLSITKEEYEAKQKELATKELLEQSYTFVSGPIERNNKKYWKVRRQNIKEYGFVDDETLIEVIPCGKYDYIGNDIIIDGKAYADVSIPYDNGCAYGLLSLDTFTEVIPCKTYRVKEIDKQEGIVECLSMDRETTDIYETDENTHVLTKTFTGKVQ